MGLVGSSLKPHSAALCFRRRSRRGWTVLIISSESAPNFDGLRRWLEQGLASWVGKLEVGTNVDFW